MNKVPLATCRFLVQMHPEVFPDDFLPWLEANFHVWESFERMAQEVIGRGFKHYSARTIIEVIRHHTAVAEVGDGWKLNDHCTPYLARLWGLTYPNNAKLFAVRATNLEKALA